MNLNIHQTLGPGAAMGRSCLLEDFVAGSAEVVGPVESVGLVEVVGHTAWDRSLSEVLPVHTGSVPEAAVLGLAYNLAFDWGRTDRIVFVEVYSQVGIVRHWRGVGVGLVAGQEVLVAGQEVLVAADIPALEDSLVVHTVQVVEDIHLGVASVECRMFQRASIADPLDCLQK